MRGLPCSIAVALGAAGCLDLPPHHTCPADDHDCDGWTTSAANPGGRDCDDEDATINPGAADPANDCIADPAGVDRLQGVTGDEAGIRGPDLDVEFNTRSRMPSSMTLGQAETLYWLQQSNCHVDDEEGLGISLYPAFALHTGTRDLSTPQGGFSVDGKGPAMASVLVSWTTTVPEEEDNAPGCVGAPTLSAALRFTLLPGNRLVRDDHVNVTVSDPVTMCQGCANAFDPMGAPIFTSYLAVVPGFDHVRLDTDPETDYPTLASGAQHVRPLGTEPHVVCTRRSPMGALAVTWQSDDLDDEGVRIRDIGPGLGRALVFDWRRGPGGVAGGSHHAITTMVALNGPANGCDGRLRDKLAESETQFTNLDFNHGLGVYEPSVAVSGGVLSFAAGGDISGGIAVRTQGFDARGVTVWRKRGNDAYVRLAGGWEYLYQRDDDGAIVVYLPSLARGDQFKIAAPGHEP